MSDPTITCPHCKKDIKLTESLAAPLVESTRREYERRLTTQTDAVAEREAALTLRESALASKVEERVKAARSSIALEERAKAQEAAREAREAQDAQMVELRAVLERQDARLAEAQQQQAALVRRERELVEAQRAMDLTIERRVTESAAQLRLKAQEEAAEQYGMTVKEREATIATLQRQVEDMNRKLSQGSQQSQGEVLELELESTLRSKFPRDTVSPVPKGEYGGDVVHRVHSPVGEHVGTILWEAKRTKNWTAGWLPKLRDDQRVAKADLAIIVSTALPEGVESFDLIDHVWVVHPRAAFALALVLRQGLVDLAVARKTSEGQSTKAEMVYSYLLGPRFKQRVQAIVEAFSVMQADLLAERKAITRAWAKREEQLERVLQGTVGLVGDLQGIAGKTMQEIEGLSFPAIEAPR